MPRPRVYTDRGLKRVGCSRCGAPASEQWQLRACVTGRMLWYPLCLAHDIELNRLVVEFLQVPRGDELLAAYIERKRAAQ